MNTREIMGGGGDFGAEGEENPGGSIFLGGVLV